MAIVQNPLINRASGSVGNSTFSKWKNKNTLRSKSINPYPAPSSPQVAARAIFKNCSEFFLQLKDFFPYLFLSKKGNLSALNSFVRRNRNLFTPDANIITDVSAFKLCFSSGSLAPGNELTSTVDNLNVVHLQLFNVFYYGDLDNFVCLVGIVLDLDTKKLYASRSYFGDVWVVRVQLEPSCSGHRLIPFACVSAPSRKLSSLSISGREFSF